MHYAARCSKNALKYIVVVLLLIRNLFMLNSAVDLTAKNAKTKFRNSSAHLPGEQLFKHPIPPSCRAEATRRRVSISGFSFFPRLPTPNCAETLFCPPFPFAAHSKQMGCGWKPAAL